MLYSLLFAFASLSTLTASQRVERATAVLQPEQTKPVRGLRNVRGTITFRRITNGNNRGNVRVSGEIRGLKANQQHGLHLHEFGDISSSNPGQPIDCLSTGAHYDPKNTKLHRGRNNNNGHQGDFGNINANRNGVARFDFVDRFISLNGIIGRGIVVHEKRDDLTSQPIGKSGGRVSCGAIGIASSRQSRSIPYKYEFDYDQFIPSTTTETSEYDQSTTESADYNETTMEPIDYADYDETTMEPIDYADDDETTLEPMYEFGDYADDDDETTLEPIDYADFDETTMEPIDYNDDDDDETIMEFGDYADDDDEEDYVDDESTDYDETTMEPIDYDDDDDETTMEFGDYAVDENDDDDDDESTMEFGDYADDDDDETTMEPIDYADYDETTMEPNGDDSDYDETTMEPEEGYEMSTSRLLDYANDDA